MQKYLDKEYLTPLHRSVAKSLKNPINVIWSMLFLVAALMLSSIDFLCGCFILPMAIIGFAAILVSNREAKLQNGDFGLRSWIFSTILGIILSAALVVLKMLESYEIFRLPISFPDTAKDLAFPLDYLNKGFTNPELVIVSVVILFLSNLFYLGTLNKILAKNLSKTFGFIVSIILSILSVGALVVDCLIRLGVISYNYQTTDAVLTYILLGVSGVLAICGLLQIISIIYSIVKTRK